MSRILPGVYTEQRSGDLAIALPVALNVLAVAGTAERGVMDTPTLITSIQLAYDTFGYPDAFDSTAEGQELSLTRAIQIAYDAGAANIYAVRVGSSSAAKASRDVASASGTCVMLEAVSEGTWGNDLAYKVEIADGDTATVGHTDSHFGYVEDTYTDSLTASSPFDYLDITSGTAYNAEAHSGNSVQVIYSAGAGTSVQMTIIHSDAHTLNESGEVDGETIALMTQLNAQTFTTHDACTIEGILVRMKRIGVAPDGSLTCNLYAVDSDHKPTGSVLATVTETFAALAPAAGVYATETFTFTTAYAMTADTEYAVEFVWTSRTQGDYVLGGLSAAGTDTYTRGYGWYSVDTGTTYNASASVADYMVDTTITIPEAYCEFVINCWGTDWPGGSYKKHIRWSGSATPTNTTEGYINYYTPTSRKVTIQYGDLEEPFWVVDGDDLVADINSATAGSSLITATADVNSAEEPSMTTNYQQFGVGLGTVGNDGATDVAASDYDDAWTALEEYYVHVVTAAGRSDRATMSALVAHCENMSGQKKERVAVGGHEYGLDLSGVMSSSGPYASKRFVWVSPGIERTNVATGDVETLNAAYTAAYLSGWLVSGDVSRSNLFKTVNVAGLESIYTEGELEQIVQRRIDPISEMAEGGYRWRESITTSSDTDWREITTVRIADYATYGLRSICNQFIGRKNLGSARQSIKNAVEGFFDTMVASEMLSDDPPPYTVDVSSTRAQQAQGIVQVTVTFKPVLAIKYIVIIEYIQ